MNGRGGRVGMGKRIKRVASYLGLDSQRDAQTLLLLLLQNGNTPHLFFYRWSHGDSVETWVLANYFTAAVRVGRGNRVQMAPINRRSNEETI